MLLTLFMSVGLYFACRKLGKLCPNRRRDFRILGLVTLIGVGVFIAGLCITYMFSFKDWEALELTAYERYIGTVFFAGEVLLILLSAELIRRGAADRSKLISLMLCIQAALIPWSSAVYFFSRSNVEYSIDLRQEFSEDLAAVELLPGGNKRLYVVCRSEMENAVLRFCLHPDTVNPPDTWWATGTPAATSAQEWMQQLAGNYDYVLLHTVSDEFYADFAEAFVPGTVIVTGQLYTVDPESGLLSPAG